MRGEMAGGVVFLLVWLVMMGGVVVGWIIFLVAAWRLMRAHENLAQRVEELVDALRSREV
ncbi:MAG: hypothetical protein R6X33_11590 [Candidatus Brocadiia bacterium]